MSLIVTIIVAVVALAAGAAGTYLYKKSVDTKKKRTAEQEAQQILNRAKAEAARVEKETRNKAKDFEAKARKQVEVDIQKQKQKLQREEQTLAEKDKRLEKDFQSKEEQLKSRVQEIVARDEKVKIAEKRLRELEAESQKYIEELKQKLESVSGLRAEDAKKELVRAMEEEAKVDGAKLAAQIEEDSKAEAETKAKRIISLAISRYAGEYAAERTVSIVPLPNEEMKGKIIGREGRNIRALEAACGVDLIVDETPEAVVISGFDPVRREVAKRSLEALMQDGRVHPSRIEEVIDKVKKDLFRSIKDDGEKACFELGITGVHPEIIKLIGSLKYRTSFTQNNYEHSIEVGFLAGMMAAEMGADVKRARRAGLLHDIGKALDHSIEGSHAVIGADFAKRHGEAEAVCHAIRSHHEDEKPNSLIAHLVQAADALSSARPGARRSMTENYVRRLEDLESIGNSFDGVIRTFALQAGRELRVIVESSRVTDEQAMMLSRDIARKIEREMSYPGQIKVMVVRETRAIEHAR